MSIELTVVPEADNIRLTLHEELGLRLGRKGWHWEDYVTAPYIILNLESVYELIKGIGIMTNATTDKHFLTLCDDDRANNSLELKGSGENAELSITSTRYGKSRKLSKVVYLPSLLGQVGSAVSDCK